MLSQGRIFPILYSNLKSRLVDIGWSNSQVFDEDFACDVEKQSHIFISAHQPQYLEVQFMLTVGMVEIQVVG